MTLKLFKLYLYIYSQILEFIVYLLYILLEIKLLSRTYCIPKVIIFADLIQF